MKIITWHRHGFITAVMGIIFLSGMVPLAFADVYINVMAVNGSPDVKDTPVKFNLPGDLKSEDILDINGLQLDYNPDDANYFVTGHVNLQPKESKTFRIRVKDIWKISPADVEQIKSEIEKGYEQIGKAYDAKNGQILKDQMLGKLDFIVRQETEADTIQKRIDAFRAYRNETQYIHDKVLAVDYWRSNPLDALKEKVIRLKLDLNNPSTSVNKKQIVKQYLPSELKPKDLVDPSGFEVRYDQVKKQPFLYKEEEIAPGEKKSYVVGIRDIWIVLQNDIDYLRKRADYAYEFLKNSKYDQSAKILYDQTMFFLKGIEDSQLIAREIKEHISAFRNNQQALIEAKTDVENLEKLLSIYREELEKSKIENVLQKMHSLKGVADLSKQIFQKKPTPSTTWSFIGWVLLFVGGLAILYFVVLLIRGGGNKKGPKAEETPSQTPPKK